VHDPKDVLVAGAALEVRESSRCCGTQRAVLVRVPE
jgi:hypothetical protein